MTQSLFIRSDFDKAKVEDLVSENYYLTKIWFRSFGKHHGIVLPLNISKMTNLEYIHFDGIYYQDIMKIIRYMNYLGMTKKIVTLFLSNIEFDYIDTNFQYLTNLLPKVNKLYIDRCSIRGRDLSKSLTSLTFLRDLHIYRSYICNMDDEKEDEDEEDEFNIVLRNLHKNRILQVLDFEEMDLTSENLMILNHIVSKLRFLKKLNIDNTPIITSNIGYEYKRRLYSPKDIAIIKEIEKKCPRLESLIY